jgi:hypothetical protein
MDLSGEDIFTVKAEDSEVIPEDEADGDYDQLYFQVISDDKIQSWQVDEFIDKYLELPALKSAGVRLADFEL